MIRAEQVLAGVRRMMEPRPLTLGCTCVAVLAIFHLQGNSVQTEAYGHSAFLWTIGRWGDTVSYGGVDYSHGWLLPLVSGWLIWRRRKELAAADHRVCPCGLWIIAAALALNYVGLQVAQTRISLISLVVLLWAIPLYLYGKSVAGKLLFPVAYLIFCIPLTFLDSLTFPLRMLAAKMAVAVLNGLGIEALRSGARIVSTAGEGFQFDVADACSGLRSLLAIAAVTSVYAHLTQRGWWRRWLLFLSAVPLAMLGNVVRIVTVALVALVFGQDVATKMYHDYSGYLVFAVVVLLMMAAGNLLNRTVRPFETSKVPSAVETVAGTGERTRSGVLSVKCAVLLGAVLLTGTAAFALRPEVRTSQECDIRPELPESLGEWTGEEVRYCTNQLCLYEEEGRVLATNAICKRCGGPMGPKSIGELAFLPADTTIVKRRYSAGGRGTVLVTIVITGAEREGIHRPERCLTAQGHQIVRTRIVNIPLGDRPGVRLTLMETSGEEGSYVLGTETPSEGFFAYWFAGQGRETPSHLERMFWLAMDRVTRGMAARWAYVSISGAKGGSQEPYMDDLRHIVPLLHKAVFARQE